MRPIFALLFVPIIGSITLDQVMTRDEQRRTGVSDLSPSQKKELEGWLNSNFEVNETDAFSSDEELTLSINIDDGSKLQLSDGTTYLIDPADRTYSRYWITPFPIKLTKSGDSDFPVKLTNTNTGTSVNGKLISTKELLQEEEEKYRQMPKNGEAPKAPMQPKGPTGTPPKEPQPSKPPSMKEPNAQ